MRAFVLVLALGASMLFAQGENMLKNPSFATDASGRPFGWRVEALEVAHVAVMVVGFCALASLLPAWRAAAMNPVDALRKE